MAKKKPETILLRVAKGALVPDDDLAVARLRARGFRTGDVVTATLRKPRDVRQHRKAHALGALLADNIDQFAGMNSHAVLKRLQLESGAGCESVAIYVPGVGMCEHRQALSLSFENMDEGQFQEVYTGLAQHVIARYWPDLDQVAVEDMASLVGMAA
jgi:hypothetical protein